MKRLYYILIVLGSLFTESCTEPYALQTESYESAIVIEATLTDEFKHQEIKLSRTHRLEENGPDVETGAVVFITDSNGNQYNFQENSDKYISQDEFKALPNATYQLHVVTSDGKTYTSTNESLSSLTNIDDVTATQGVNTNGEEGVQILANSTKSTAGIEYYRFDYEETNKIIAPHWISRQGTVVYSTQPLPNGGPGKIEMIDWPYEAKTCYTTEQSKEISISNTSLNSSNSNVSFIRFLKASDYKIANRYSIKVTMHNESLEAYNFYDALKKSSTGGSLLSQNQPGFFSGNIKNQSNQSEKVIGFFDVSHVSSKRIFFNFEDIFPNHQRPEYPYFCPVVTPLNEDKFKFYYCFCVGPGCPTDPSCAGFYILESVRIKMKAVYIYGDEFIYLTNIECGDCTSFSSNVRPSFWVD
ncbi:DUF4249 domain-containing protein [Flavobacterium amniphilum]|uniref:DUF4249 domain-containing protein n=1 Tax=Flavobacterium amniphilum TaxID=1834035 RepID=UPI002029CC27|nr:DUF4249 domain-containing protein [Flavobacterium amniphilum]MCL9804709.1 DUF4249 domain-containing protein [Flavobacterium amniphilum]